MTDQFDQDKLSIERLIIEEKPRLDDGKIITFNRQTELSDVDKLNLSFPGYKIEKLYPAYDFNPDDTKYYYIKRRKNKLNELLQVLPRHLKWIESFKDHKLVIQTYRNETISIFFARGDKGFTVKVRSQDELSEITGYTHDEVVNKLKMYKIKSYDYKLK